jgi:hypothetical protein
MSAIYQGNRMSLFRSTALGLALAVMAPAAFADAHAPLRPDQVKINELLGETQKSSPSTKVIDLVWWIPPQFWAAALANEKDGDFRKEVDDIFSKYTVVAVVRGDLGSLGVNRYATEPELRQGLTFTGSDGAVRQPLPADKVDPRLDTLIQMLKPMFSSMLGQMGSNVNFFVFPAKDETGKPLADPLGKGSLTVTMAGQPYVFRLPLGSLLKPQQDPASGEIFPGSYEFNPYTGAALQSVAQ